MRVRIGCTALRIALGALLWVAMGPATGLAGSPADRWLEDLPRAWCGTFRWQSDDQVQHVSLRFDWSRQILNGWVELGGTGVYADDRRVVITVRAVVDPFEGAIEIWESNPSAAGFTTDGSHVGRVAPDLQTITARWRPRGPGSTGTLVLHAVAPSADPEACDSVPAN